VPVLPGLPELPGLPGLPELPGLPGLPELLGGIPGATESGAEGTIWTVKSGVLEVLRGPGAFSYPGSLISGSSSVFKSSSSPLTRNLLNI